MPDRKILHANSRSGYKIPPNKYAHPFGGTKLPFIHRIFGPSQCAVSIHTMRFDHLLMTLQIEDAFVRVLLVIDHIFLESWNCRNWKTKSSGTDLSFGAIVALASCVGVGPFSSYELSLAVGHGHVPSLSCDQIDCWNVENGGGPSATPRLRQSKTS